MATHRLCITISVRWWVPIYLRTLAFVAVTFATEPDLEKVGSFVMRYGLRVEVAGR